MTSPSDPSATRDPDREPESESDRRAARPKDADAERAGDADHGAAGREEAGDRADRDLLQPRPRPQRSGAPLDREPRDPEDRHVCAPTDP